MRLTVPYLGQPPAAEVRRQLAAVYQSPELAGLRHPAKGGGSLLSQLGKLLLSWLESIFRAGGPLLWVVLGTIALALILVLSATLLRRQRGGLAPPAGPPLPAERGRQRPSPEYLFGRAEALQRQGRMRDAVRAAFQGLLLATADPAALGFEPSWTNSELLLAAARRSGLEARLRPLVASFDSVVYGGREPTTSACRDFTASCRATAAALGR